MVRQHQDGTAIQSWCVCERVAYLYNRARSVTDGTSVIAASNWAGTLVGVDVNDPPMTRSIYEVGHRVTAVAIASIPVFRRVRSTVSVVYIGQSGQPYVLVFGGDANGDNRLNDIVFVAAAADQVIVAGGTWEQLDAYFRGDASARNHRGRTPPRNSGLSPGPTCWTSVWPLTCPRAAERR